MSRYSALLLPLLALGLSGCIARTAADIVTLPVKAAGAGVDAVTTSQSEADEKRGREIRKREERIGKLTRKRDKLARQCYRDEDDGRCRELREVEIQLDMERSRPY